jgi:hypothetical protein
MGLDTHCRVDLPGRSGEARVLLEENVLIVRGGPRISFREIRSVSVENGCLELFYGTERARLHLGAKAELWAQKIRSPKPLMEKLGVKEDSSVCLVGLKDEGLLEEFKKRAARVSTKMLPGAPLVFVSMKEKGELGKLSSLRARLDPAGALWILWKKGQKQFREDDIRAALREAGLVDVKVVSVSEVWSGLKTVIPLAERKEKRRSDR